MSSDTTIGIVTYNRLDLTKKTFEGALKNTGKQYDLIVCDNASSDGTLDWLNSLNVSEALPECNSLTVVPLKKNYGVAYGRNVCLKRMKTETKFICTLDNDVMIPNQTWLKDCCDVLEANEKFGCCAINYERKNFPITTISLKDGRKLQVRIIINTPGTATTVFRRDIHDKIGYFKRYSSGIYGHEDANFFFSYQVHGKDTALPQ